MTISLPDTVPVAADHPAARRPFRAPTTVRLAGRAFHWKRSHVTMARSE